MPGARSGRRRGHWMLRIVNPKKLSCGREQEGAGRRSAAPEAKVCSGNFVKNWGNCRNKFQRKHLGGGEMASVWAENQGEKISGVITLRAKEKTEPAKSKMG